MIMPIWLGAWCNNEGFEAFMAFYGILDLACIPRPVPRESEPYLTLQSYFAINDWSTQ